MLKQSSKGVIQKFIMLGMALWVTQVHADGVTDLKAALVKLQGNTPLKASIESKSWNRQGEGN